MLHATELVEPGRRPREAADQVVLWHRRYPFAFLKDRYYVLARCVTRRGGAGGGGDAGAGGGGGAGSADAAAPVYGLSRAVPSAVADAYAADALPGAPRKWGCE